jgi:hypothetical protein
MAKPGFKDIKYDAIVDWLVLNPEKNQRDCADHFGLTQGWLSILIRSDMFQAKLQARRAEVTSRVASAIPEKLKAVADIALDKLADQVAKSEDPEFILNAADKALHRMGFAPATARSPGALTPPGGMQQNNFFMVGTEDLALARARMKLVGESAGDALPVPLPEAAAELLAAEEPKDD